MKKPLLTALFFLLTIPFFIFPAAALDEEPAEHSLQIQYLNEDGSQAFPTYSARIAEGEEYSVPSPVSEEASPNPETVSGVMGGEDVEEVVTYGLKYYIYAKTTSRRTGKDLSTFRFGPDDGNKTAICKAPTLRGYSSPNPTEIKVFIDYQNQNIAFTYYPNRYNVTFNFLYSDGTAAFAPLTTSIYYDDPVTVYCPPLEGYQPFCGALGQPLKSTAIDTSFDVVYTPKDCTLTIKYQYADGSEAFPPYTGTVKYNGNYSVESPALLGYEPNIPVVSGVMNSDGREIVVTYLRGNPILTIDYLYPDGSQAAPSAKSAIKTGQSYTIMSPLVPGYTPDKPVISGVMGSEDIHVTVTYNKTKYLLTIKYNYPNGSRIAPDYTGRYEEGENYEVPSPSVIGYTTGTDVISGIMPAHNVVKTATYYLEGSAVMGDMSNLLDAVSSSGEYIQVYISKTLLTLITAGIIIFAAFMALRLALYIIRRFIRS